MMLALRSHHYLVAALPGMIGEQIASSLVEELDEAMCIYSIWGVLVRTPSALKHRPNNGIPASLRKANKVSCKTNCGLPQHARLAIMFETSRD